MNFNVKHKIFFVLFFVTFITYTVIHFQTLAGVFFDVPALFLKSFSDDKIFVFFTDITGRNFCLFLVSVVYNFIFRLLNTSDSIITCIEGFSLSYFAVHLFLILANWFVAKKTERYDIFIISIAFYTMFCIPNLIWNIREFHIGFLLNFLLLQCFLSKAEFRKKEYILIAFLAVIMAETMEFNFIISAMLIFYTFIYCKKYRNDINNRTKRYIAAFSGIPLIYIPAKAIITMIYLRPTAANEWIACTLNSLSNLTDTILISSLFAIIAVIFLFFFKKDINLKTSPLLIGFFLLCLLVFCIRVGFSEYQFNREISGYMFSIIMFFALYTLILVCDYVDFKIEKFNLSFYGNLMIVACIFGILNSFWQIHNCFGQQKYLNYLKDLLKSSDEIIIQIPVEKYDENTENANLLKASPKFGTILISVLLSDNYTVKKIIFPSNYLKGEINYTDTKYTNFNKDANILIIEEAPLEIRTRYWDFLPVAEEFIKKNKISSVGQD